MRNKQKHIIFLTPGFASCEKDSTSIPALQVYLKSFRKIQPSVKMTIIAFQFPFKKEIYQWNEIEVIPLNGRNRILKKVWVWRKAIKILASIHERSPITCIHSFWIGECSFIGELFSKRHEINHVTTVMGQDANSKSFFSKYSKNSNAKIVTLSKNHHNVLLKKHSIFSKIIPWHLDVSLFPPLEKSKIDILGVGSLNVVKNYSFFINIIYQLVKTYPFISVEIIGEGTERFKLEKQIEQFNLDKNIKLLGELPRNKVVKKMSQSNILLHTSHYESFGFVFLEALYAGMRIVSKDIGMAYDCPEWKLCDYRELDFVEGCIFFLKNKKHSKKRLQYGNVNQTIDSYIELYNS